MTMTRVRQIGVWGGVGRGGVGWGGVGWGGVGWGVRPREKEKLCVLPCLGDGYSLENKLCEPSCVQCQCLEHV